MACFSFSAVSAEESKTFIRGSREGNRIQHQGVDFRLFQAVGVEKDLAGFAGLEPVHAFGEIFHGDAVGDDGREVELTGLQKVLHLEPCLVHEAAVNADDGRSLKDDGFRQVDFHRLRGRTQHGHASAGAQDVKACSDAWSLAAHLEDHVGTDAVRGVEDDLFRVLRGGIDHYIRFHLFCEPGAMLIGFEREDLRCSDGARDGDGEESNRTAADDRDRAGGDLAGENGVDGVAERIEQRGVVGWDGRIDLPDVRFGDAHVLGEGAVFVDTNDLYIGADVSFADAALITLAAGDVHLGGDEVAFLDGGDFVADGDDIAAELMPGYERRLDARGGPLVPVIYMEVGAADAGDLHLHQNVARAVARDGDFADLRACLRLRLDYRHHGLLHRSGQKGDFNIF